MSLTRLTYKVIVVTRDKTYNVRLRHLSIAEVWTCNTMYLHCVSFFFLKMGQPRPLFVYFRSFKTKITNFTTNLCEKMSIQYKVPGFEPTTFGMWVSSHNHKIRAPALCQFLIWTIIGSVRAKMFYSIVPERRCCKCKKVLKLKTSRCNKFYCSRQKKIPSLIHEEMHFGTYLPTSFVPTFLPTHPPKYLPIHRLILQR